MKAFANIFLALAVPHLMMMHPTQNVQPNVLDKRQYENTYSTPGAASNLETYVTSTRSQPVCATTTVTVYVTVNNAVATTTSQAYVPPVTTTKPYEAPRPTSKPYEAPQPTSKPYEAPQPTSKPY